MMKWMTAYAMDELTKGIIENHKEAMKENIVYEKMTLEEIEHVLQQAFLTHVPVLFQTEEKDEFLRYFPLQEGDFLGETTLEKVKLGQQWIHWEDLRYVTLGKREKWFVVQPFYEEDSVK